MPQYTFSELLRGDIKRSEGGKVSLWQGIFLFRKAFFRAVLFYRISAYFCGKTILERAISVFFYELNIVMHGCAISPRAQIGPGLYTPHPFGIVIGPATIGKNLLILHCATIGMARPDDIHTPESFATVGDNVYIGSGACISGPIKLGDNARIGANAVALQNVPSDSTAVGIPARIIIRKETS